MQREQAWEIFVPSLKLSVHFAKYWKKID